MHRLFSSALFSGAAACLLVAVPAHAAEHATLTARATASQQVSFNVYVPLQHRDQLESFLKDVHDTNSPNFGKWLTPAEFHQRFSPNAKQMSALQQRLSAEGLTVTQTSARNLRISGPAPVVERAFGTTLKTGKLANGRSVVAATGQLTLPTAITEVGGIVTGLSSAVHLHSQAHLVPENRYSAEGPYWFTDLKQAYKFPSYQTYSGKGSTVAVLITSALNQADMDLYFGHEKIASPKITEIKVDGGAPFDPASGGSFEANLDMQQVGGMAPNANILLYNIPDLSDTSFYDGLTQIVNDNKADVVNMSFGGAEIFYTAAYNDGVDYTSTLQIFDDLFAQGNAEGITFVASSGDSGALAAVPPACFAASVEGAPASCGSFLASVEFPSSSPHVTSVGGTNLVTTSRTGSLNSSYVSEEAFADPLTQDIFFGTTATGGYWGSGGGDSIYFTKPAYQYLVKTGNPNFRTTPDISLHMGGCPGGAVQPCNPEDSADLEVLGGKLYGVIGTSASSPDIAGLTALAVERYGHRMGNTNYYIYSLASAQAYGLVPKVFHTGIVGYNGLFFTTPKGYNRVLGNGTINANNYLLNLGGPVAGAPQTPSNP